MWVRILTEGDYPGLSGWALNASTCILRRGMQREVWPKPGGGRKIKILLHSGSWFLYVMAQRLTSGTGWGACSKDSHRIGACWPARPSGQWDHSARGWRGSALLCQLLHLLCLWGPSTHFSCTCPSPLSRISPSPWGCWFSSPYLGSACGSG